MIESDLHKKGFLYSHAGKVSTEKFSFLLDRKSHIDKILAGIKRAKLIEEDYLDKEDSVDDELQNQINDIEDNDIFTKEYETKHISDLNEQKLKYFSNVKNPCTYIESKIKNKTRNKNIIKPKKNNGDDNNNNNGDDNNNNGDDNNKKTSNEIKAKEELKKLIFSSNNKFNYYYHLLHHTDNSNYYSEDENNNMIIFGPEVNATRYNPKLEYIYPKIIYSPSFKLMSGRYDYQILSNLVKSKLEKSKNKKKEIEKEKRMQKIKESVNAKLDTLYKFPTFYNEKNNEFIKNNEQLREMRELKRNESLIVDTPMIKNKILGDIEMEKQLQRGDLPEHHDVRIRNQKAFNSCLNKNDNKALEQIGGNRSNSLLLYDNNTINNETSLINNKNNSNINNNSSLNNNDTLYTSNALKNEYATLYNTNSNNNESNNNSNINFQNKSNSINIGFNNNNLITRMKNLKNINNNVNQKYFKKINVFKDQKKTFYTTSKSNIFKNMNKTSMSKMNKTIGTNIFQKKSGSTYNFNGKTYSRFFSKNNSLTNINSNKLKLKTINFDKMLSRQYLDNLDYEEEPLHPQVNPKYTYVQPKCIMKVVYANKTYHKSIKKFEGLGEEVTFDADKLFYKYNDHFPTKSFYFNKMSGRSSSIDGCLPSYMVNLGNRNSCIDFNDKSYKLNNFSEGKLKEQRSSFNQHKSFNSKLNMNSIILKEINKKKEENSEICQIYKKLKGENKNVRRKKKEIPGQRFMSISLKKNADNILPEFYRVNLDKVDFFRNRIDGITLKTYNKSIDERKQLLSNHDKKIFLVNTQNLS